MPSRGTSKVISSGRRSGESIGVCGGGLFIVEVKESMGRGRGVARGEEGSIMIGERSLRGWSDRQGCKVGDRWGSSRIDPCEMEIGQSILAYL